MKTKRTILMAVAFIMMAGLAFAGEAEVNVAKTGLYQEISECFKEDISNWNNYFFKNNINNVDEKLEISFYVNDDQSLSVFRIRCENPEACEYVKSVFKANKMYADKVLTGKAYTFRLHLLYKAR